MKSRFLFVALFGLATIIVNDSVAQKFRITAYGMNANIFGDFSETDLTNDKAGYVDFGFGSGIELNYYLPNNLGLGFRWSGMIYDRDQTSYEADLRKALGAEQSLFDLSETEGYFSFGSSLGLSYVFQISEPFSIEPYFFIGYRALVSDEERAIYNIDGTTINYQKKSQLFSGVSYAPGMKFHYNFGGVFGLNLFAEYEGVSFGDDFEKVIISTATDLEISRRNRSYNVQSLNIGLGLTFTFGPEESE